MTTDYGNSWKRITTGKNGIPIDTPTRVVREDPDREGLLYAGTEFGMYISFDDGEHWQVFQLNLPVTPVTDIKVHKGDLILSTMGRSFWILDNITPLHYFSEDTKDSLFTPRKTYRMRFRASRGSSAAPEYPSPGVIFDYVLAEEPKEDIVLNIQDSSGQKVRTFSSAAGQPRLKKTVGAHRFLWDMRRELPVDESAAGQSRRPRRGPLVLPGAYQGTITIGEWSQRVQIEILLDPRVAADGVTLSDLKEQEQLNLKVLKLQNRARNTTNRLEKEMDKLSSKTEGGKKLSRREINLETKLGAVKSKLITSRGRYQQPMILDQIGYLAGMLDRADQKPGRDAYIRYDELQDALIQCERDISQALEQQN